ncbi:MAG: DUF481 domain-containing protein [Myxococcaceae bacterium]
MLPFKLVLLVALSQTPPADTVATPNSTDDRALKAMERTAAAAERTAEAAERIAKATEKNGQQETLIPPPPGGTVATTETEWRGTLGLGLVSLTGNAETLTFTGLAALEKKTEHWILAAKASGAYGQARSASDIGTDASVVALRAMGELRGDRRLTERVSAYLLGGAETDHVKSVEARLYGEAGASNVWLERKEGDLNTLLLRTDLALRYAKEQRFQYYPTPLNVDDVDLLGPRFGLAFHYALNKEVQFSEDAEIIPNILSDSRVLVNSTTKLSSRLTQSLSLNVSFVVNHDSKPAPLKKPTDTALMAGLEMAL